MATSCTLDAYRVTILKNNKPLSLAGARLQSIAYSRVLDDVSVATVEYINTGPECCGQIGAADHFNCDLVIAVPNQSGQGFDEVVWRGPINKASYYKGRTIINACDVLKWAQKRVVSTDLNYVNTDVVDIGIGLWNNSVANADAPIYSIVRYASGVLESRKVEANSYRYAWNVIQEMLQTGLDVTTFGSQIIFGVPPFNVINLTDNDVQGDNVYVEKDGDAFADRVIVTASRDIVGIYPPGPRTGSNGYPLIEVVINDSQLQDQISADNAAKARYDFGRTGVRRVRAEGGLVLLPDAKLDVKRVIAGQLVTFSADETCYTAQETFRLGRLDVVVASGQEVATISLQPIGVAEGE